MKPPIANQPTVFAMEFAAKCKETKQNENKCFCIRNSSSNTPFVTEATQTFSNLRNQPPRKSPNLMSQSNYEIPGPAAPVYGSPMPAQFTAPATQIYDNPDVMQPVPSPSMQPTFYPNPGMGPQGARSCSAHPRCQALGLGGDCCPTLAGVFLGCCDAQVPQGPQGSGPSLLSSLFR